MAATSRRLRIAAGLALAAALMVLAGCGSDAPAPAASPALPAQDASPAALVTFRDLKAGFTIGHPEDWQAKTDVAGTLVAFVSPAGGSAGFTDSANVTQEAVGAVTLEEYNASARSQIQAAFPNAAFLDEGATTMGGEPAFFYEYTSQQGAGEIHIEQVFSLRDGTVTAMTFAASADGWGALAPTFDAMAASFAYLGSEGSTQASP